MKYFINRCLLFLSSFLMWLYYVQFKLKSEAIVIRAQEVLASSDGMRFTWRLNYIGCEWCRNTEKLESKAIFILYSDESLTDKKYACPYTYMYHDRLLLADLRRVMKKKNKMGHNRIFNELYVIEWQLRSNNRAKQLSKM